MKKLDEKHIEQPRPVITPEQQEKLQQNPAWTAIWDRIIERAIERMRSENVTDERAASQ